MRHHQKAFKLFICIFILVMAEVNCNDNTAHYKFQFKKNYNEEYVRQYNMNHPPPLPTNGSYYKNKLGLPEKAIYCTIIPTNHTDQYPFLRKYYTNIAVKPDQYTNTIECIYPRSVEFPDLEDEIPKPKLTPLEKLSEALMEHSSNFREFLDKVDKGEKPEPMKPFDAEYFADEIINDIFHHKPDPKDIVDASSPNGIICERIKFIESGEQDLEIIRPICYPAPRPPPPPPPPTTTPKPTTTTNASDIYDKACYVLCHTGAIYQLLPCCRK